MILAVCLSFVLQTPSVPTPDAAPLRLSTDQIRRAGEVIGLDYTEDELKMMQKSIVEQLDTFQTLQRIGLDNAVPPALTFSPLLPGMKVRPPRFEAKPVALADVARPKDLEELAFADIPTLAGLVKSRKVSCVELATMYITRLKRLDPTLHCVINFTEERAMKQARALDAELKDGKWRGPLHGLPWGAKDLLAVKGTPTTWGSKIYEHQMLDEDATVVKRLDAAGAVLIAKTTLGEFAYGDLWFGGRTRNPWKPDDGSSGSSAGSCSATAAGCVAFAIGTETLGSIVSPSSKCGTSGLRPTFGRVSRAGAMALSWSMDKIGAIARSVQDASLVLAVIQGPDGIDASVHDQPYSAGSDVDVKGWKVGYVALAFDNSADDKHVLDELKSLGVELVPIELPQTIPASDLMIILTSEAATAFDELTRDGRDEEMVWQDPEAWPNTFRAARLIPAVEYIRANRLRTLLMRDMQKVMETVDLYVSPSFGGGSLGITNLTGHPAVVAPSGFRKDGTPRSITFTGQLFGEAELCALAQAWQRSTSYHQQHPKL